VVASRGFRATALPIHNGDGERRDSGRGKVHRFLSHERFPRETNGRVIARSSAVAPYPRECCFPGKLVVDENGTAQPSQPAIWKTHQLKNRPNRLKVALRASERRKRRTGSLKARGGGPGGYGADSRATAEHRAFPTLNSRVHNSTFARGGIRSRSRIDTSTLHRLGWAHRASPIHDAEKPTPNHVFPIPEPIGLRYAGKWPV
jgi:hypothetical protein